MVVYNHLIFPRCILHVILCSNMKINTVNKGQWTMSFRIAMYRLLSGNRLHCHPSKCDDYDARDSHSGVFWGIMPYRSGSGLRYD
jgi:hypothetical protein